MTVSIKQSAKVPAAGIGKRLDQVASELFPDFSRSRLQSWIKSGALQADGRKLKPNAKLAGGESLALEAEIEDQEQWVPEDIAIDCVYQDDSIIVVNKPSGLVVHPAAGNWSGTLLNGLIFHYPELNHIPRAGIVHRLDKDTSGLMVVARTVGAQLSLVEQLQARSVSRTYWALAYGAVQCADFVSAPIGRHPGVRTKMAVVASGGKEAITHYKPLRNFGDRCTLLELKLETGRTHQIRVHMDHLGHPLVGDPIYGAKQRDLISFERQALHAKALGLDHPDTSGECNWETELPNDFENLLDRVAEL
jgi:23S rRNA pseudouridine1911/1915/1917 synthase